MTPELFDLAAFGRIVVSGFVIVVALSAMALTAKAWLR